MPAKKLRARAVPSGSKGALGNDAHGQSRIKVVAATSTPNLRAARMKSPLPETPPDLPLRPVGQGRTSSAAVAHVAQHQHGTRPPLAHRPAPHHGRLSPPPAAMYQCRSAPIVPTAYSSTQASGYFEPDAGLTNDVSDRMSIILIAIDEDDMSPEKISPELPMSTARGSSGLPTAPSKPTRFSKVWLYTNSRLPPHLPPLKLYIPTWPLLCLCAQHSLSVYSPSPKDIPPTHARPASINTLIPGSRRNGIKPMTLTAHPLSTSNHIILAVRGTATLADWALNSWSTPASPAGFLDDPGNLVHAGFLHAARGLAPILAQKLRSLLAERPGRAACSLVLTGHSAGGAVATLLYAHMVSAAPDVTSQLKGTAALFKRAHCVTFGAPPVSLLPLQKPSAAPEPMSPEDHDRARRLQKSVFFAFANEGDPVVRADPAVAKSLLCLYAAPTPAAHAAAWPVPPGAYSLAGRVILLRGSERGPEDKGEKGKTRGGLSALLFKRTAAAAADDVADVGGVSAAKNIAAYTVADEAFRGVVFGDPVMHSMRVYKERVEGLAVAAVTGTGTGFA